MRVAIYTRVSTDDQTTKNQLPDLQRYCESRGWTDTTHFNDLGISGAKTSRPAFDDLMSQCEQGKFDVVVIWRLDRMGRSTVHLLEIAQFLQKCGVEFVSTREAIDTSTASGRFQYTMFAASAQYERDMISERTRAAMQRLKAEGKKFGRQKQYDRSKVIELRNQGVKTPEIAQRLGISKSHCRRIIRDAA